MPTTLGVCRTTACAHKLDVVRPRSIQDHFLDPQNVGSIERPDGFGNAASFSCGGMVRLDLRIDAEKKIQQAKFKAIGCHILVASASLLTQQVQGRTTGEAAQIAKHWDPDSDFGAIEEGETAAPRPQCISLCQEALLSAIAKFSDAARDEWSGDDALICTCFGVTEMEIEQEISARSCETIDDVTGACRAGAGCRSCYSLIQDILDTHWRESRLPDQTIR
jgi:NifU-like protein